MTESTHINNNKIGTNLVHNSPKINNGVYIIPCSSCNHVYVGETGRDLNVRIKEHQRDFSEKKLSSAAVSHFFDTGHSLNFKNAELRYKNKNINKRHIIESALINQNKALCINQNLGFSPFNNVLSKIILQSTKVKFK